MGVLVNLIVVIISQHMCVLSHFSHVQLFATYGLWPANLCPWGSIGTNTGMGCHFFLEGIFQTQG